MSVSIILVIFKGKFQPIWCYSVQLVTVGPCGLGYVWRPWRSSHIWLRSWQTKGHKAREQLHTAVQQPPPGTASINTWLTYTLKCRVKVS